MSIISRLTKVNWIAEVLTPSAVILAETFWLYPWLVFIGKVRELDVKTTHLNLLALIILLGLSFIATKIFLKLKWPMFWVQLIILISGLAAIFFVLRIQYGDGSSLFSGQWFYTYGQVIAHIFNYTHPIVFGIVAGIYLWWRGIVLGRSRFYFEDIYHVFLIQLATLIFLVILWGFSFKNEGVSALTSDIGIFVIGFFFFGLVAVALSNLMVVLEKMKKKGESSRTFARRWLTIILTVIGGMILLGIGFVSIFSAQFVAALGRFLRAVSNVYGKVVELLIYAVGFIVQLISYVYEWLLSLIKRGKQPDALKLEPADVLKKLDGTGPQPFPAWVLVAVKITIFVLIVGFVIFLIFRAVKRLRHTQTDEDLNEENESLWSWSSFKSDIAAFFATLFGRFKRKKNPLPVNEEIKWRPAEDVKRKLSIRQIYQHLLWQGARLSIPREEYETPSEYARRLGRFAPDSKEPVNNITGLYLEMRYGELKIDDNKTDDANVVWQNLLNILKEHEVQ